MVLVEELILCKGSSTNYFSEKMLKSLVRRFMVKFKFQPISFLPNYPHLKYFNHVNKKEQPTKQSTEIVSVVHGPTASALPETLLEKQILSLHNRPTK